MPTEFPANFFQEVVDESEFGPLMAALLPRQKAFILAFFAAGDGNAAAAARAAGYSNKSAISLRVHGHALLHSPKVQAAMHEFARSRLQSAVPARLKELDYLASNRKEVKPETRLKAVLGSLSRAGLGGEVNVNSNMNIVVSFDEKLSELKRLAALAGDDVDKAIEGLVAPSDGAGVSDAEYEEIA